MTIWRRPSLKDLVQYIIGLQLLLADMADHADGSLAGGTAWHGSSDLHQPLKSSQRKQFRCTLFDTQIS